MVVCGLDFRSRIYRLASRLPRVSIFPGCRKSQVSIARSRLSIFSGRDGSHDFIIESDIVLLRTHGVGHVHRIEHLNVNPSEPGHPV